MSDKPDRTDLLQASVAFCVLEHLRERVEGYSAFCTRNETLQRHGGRRGEGEFEAGADEQTSK